MKSIIFFHRKSLKDNAAVERVVQYICNKVLVDYRVHVYYYYPFLHRVLEKLNIEFLIYQFLKALKKPDLLLFMDESASNHIAIKSRKAIKAPTLNFSHAIVGNNSFYQNINFDHYFVYGKKCIDSTIGFGLNTNKTSLKPIGPFFCAVRALATGGELSDILKITSTHSKSGLTPFKLKICITSQWWSEKNSLNIKSAYEQLVELAKKRTDLFFYVKPHPLEADDRSPLNQASHLPNVEILSKQSSVMDLAPFVDLHVTVFSNSAIDFALFGIPTVFYCDTEGVAFKYRLVPENYSLLSENNEALELIVDKHLYGPESAAALLQHNTDGRGFDSISRFKDEIAKIVIGPKQAH